MFYKISNKESLKIRNEIFVEKGIPALEKNGFERSPFPNFWYGKDDIGGYTYEMCKLSENSHVEFIMILIVKGDNWIRVYLNIFELKPKLKLISQLKDLDGIQFRLPPNSVTQMRLRIDDFKGIPLFRTKEHVLKSFRSERGLKNRIEQLSNLIEKDLTNIDHFIKRWYEIHGQPMVTDCNGHQIA